MILYPAIDIYEKECVRLEKGNFDKKTVFNQNPLEQAQFFKETGCSWIHIVDLNAARYGNSENFEIIDLITKETSINIQFGGGVRSIGVIEKYLNIGVKKIVIGTEAIRNNDFMTEAVSTFPENILIAIDARQGKISIEGWTKDIEVTPLAFAKIAEDKGAKGIIFTDIERDGMMKGPNISSTIKLANFLNIPVIASGGVKDIDDIKELKTNEEKGISGVICGKSIYTGNIKIAEVLKISGIQ